MRSGELLADVFGRIRQEVAEAVEGLTTRELCSRPDPEANTIAWLVWHLTRVQDDHVAAAAEGEQTWLTGGWADRFGLPFGSSATGYGQSSEEVAAVTADAELLVGYQDAVSAEVCRYVAGLGDDDFDRVVDRRWDPPVTLGVRLVSVLSDCLQHVGQAAYVRGLLLRSRDS